MMGMFWMMTDVLLIAELSNSGPVHLLHLLARLLAMMVEFVGMKSVMMVISLTETVVVQLAKFNLVLPA